MPSIPLEIPIVASHVESSPPRSSPNATSGDTSSFGEHLQRAKSPAAGTKEAENARAPEKREPATTVSQSTETAKQDNSAIEDEKAAAAEGLGESDKALSTDEKKSTIDSEVIVESVDNQVVAANVALQLAQNVTAVEKPLTSHEEPLLVKETEKDSVASEKGNKKPSKEGKKVAAISNLSSKSTGKKEATNSKELASDAPPAEKQTTGEDKLATAAKVSQDVVTQGADKTASDVAIATHALKESVEENTVESDASVSIKADKPKVKPTTKVSSDSIESTESEPDEVAPTDEDRSDRRVSSSSPQSVNSDPSPTNRPKVTAQPDHSGTTAVSPAAALAASAAVTATTDTANTEATIKHQERTKSARAKTDSVEGAKPSEAPQASTNSSQTTQPTSTLNTRAPAPLVDLPATNKLGSRSAGANTNLNEVDRVRFVQRVTRAVMSAAERGGDIRLRLSPPELGAIKLEVVVRDGVMNARLETQTEAAKTILLDNLQSLRDRLAQQDIQIDQFDVDVQSGFSGSLPDRTPEQQEAATQRPTFARAEKGGRNGERADSIPTPPIGYRVSRDGRLNVIV